jgi:hypothetical protein
MNQNSGEEAPQSGVDVHELHRVTPADARAFVDQTLGAADTWASPLISYRLSADAQADWKVELGNWLKVAEQNGFLDRLMHDVQSQARRPSKLTTKDPNDRNHLKLHHYVAAARVTHYLTALGWSFGAFEPETGGDVDIDLQLKSPNGAPVEFQIKAPDQPGRIENHRIVDGEFDERVIAAVEHAAIQLRHPARAPAIIAICANRDFPLCWELRRLVHLLVGSTKQVGSSVFLEKNDTGKFWSPDWSHVSGVFLLDLVRGIDIESGGDVAKYISACLLNPNASFPILPSWFSRSRVLGFAGDVFEWMGGDARHSTVPSGTRLVDEIPESAWAAHCEPT